MTQIDIPVSREPRVSRLLARTAPLAGSAQPLAGRAPVLGAESSSLAAPFGGLVWGDQERRAEAPVQELSSGSLVLRSPARSAASLAVVQPSPTAGTPRPVAREVADATPPPEPVMRQAAASSPAVGTTPSPSPMPPITTTAAAPPAGAAKGMSPAELEELAQSLYQRIRSRLLHELRLDRERVGLFTNQSL